MIKITQSVSADPIPDLVAFIDSIDNLVQEIAQSVTTKYETAIIGELSAPVGAVKYPIQWASERQRKAFFASDGFGGGIPTRRTGALQAGWVVAVERNGRTSAIVIFNKQDYAKFVVGSLAQDVTQARRFQQPFHRNTGYPLATETVQYWLDVMTTEFLQLYNDRIGEFAKLKTKRRASTN